MKVNCRHIDNCALCGKLCDLNFEHVPPKKAFNWTRTKSISGDALINTVSDERKPWDLDGLHYSNLQKGHGFYSLCQKCNSFTGGIYGKEYVKVAHGFHNLIKSSNLSVNDIVYAKIESFQPLPFIKQILSMFCSVNRKIANDSRIKYLREFVLDKDATCLPKDKYRINMYLCNLGLQRYAALSAQLQLFGGTRKPIIDCFSEIATYPMGFILCFNPTEVSSYTYPDITSFSDYKYDDKCTVEMHIPYLECNTMFPADFRSKKEIEDCITENKAWIKAHTD